MYILTADFGTSSVKMSIVDEKLNIIRSTKQYYEYDVIENVRVQIDPEKCYKGFLDGLKIFADDLDKIEVICMDTFCTSVLPMDENGKALYPVIVHLDRRSEAQSHKLLALVGQERFLNITGNLPFTGGVSLTSLMWIRDNHPDIFEKTYMFGHINTYLYKRMVNKWLIDATHASFTGLYETVKAGSWSEEMCRLVDFPIHKLPRLVPCDSIIGTVDRSLAAQTGLKTGIPIVMGANDTSVGAFGSDTVEEGSILNISGSNEILAIATDRPIPHPKILLRTHVIPGKWLPFAITIGGGALEWLRKEFYREMESNKFYNEYFPRYVSERFNKDSGVVFTPYLAGDRHSIEQKKASISGLTLESSRDDILGALLLGMFEPIQICLNAYRDVVTFKKDVCLTGGMVNPAYLEFKKRIFQEFTFHFMDECPTIGSAKLALQALRQQNYI
ncbi:MAG: FGGY-family carbohydrate kinase [Christensenellales bacterium]